MPVPLIAEGFGRGLGNVPYIWTTVKAAILIFSLYVLKVYFNGAKCKAERVMHGRVFMVTGGTSGVGAAVVRDLATRGAQIVLLTQHEPTDPFLVEYIDDLRTASNNEMIYAEQVDLSSLHSIRTFATKWVDNAPPRRLDGIVLCAATMTPYWGEGSVTADGLEEEWMINYAATFHLMSILSPALRAQPPDRDVRIIFSTCSSYIYGSLELKETELATKNGSRSHARAKLALMNFVHAFQKHLDSYDRPDKHVMNARTFIVDPGFCRTPGTRRWLTGGSLLGLLFYLCTWPLWWLILKSPDQGAQSYLYALMEADLGRGVGGKLIKECREIQPLRPEVKDETVAKGLWEYTEKQIENLEKKGAIRRKLEKKEKESAEKQQENHKSDASGKDSTATASGGDKQQGRSSRKSRKI